MGFPCVQITEDATFITNEMYEGEYILQQFINFIAKKTPKKHTSGFFMNDISTQEGYYIFFC